MNKKLTRAKNIRRNKDAKVHVIYIHKQVPELLELYCIYLLRYQQFIKQNI